MEPPWLVLLPEKLLGAAKSVTLMGNVDEERRVVWVKGEGRRVGSVRGKEVSLQAASGPLHILLHDPDLLSRLLTSHCRSCRHRLVGERLDGCEAQFSPFCVCQRRNESADEATGILSYSHLWRVLHQRRRNWSFPGVGFDLVLGFIFVSVFSVLMTPEVVKNATISSSEAVTTAVDFLQRLIRWLMGAPIGLKVNRNLSWALGQFYIYHVNLWSDYISTLVVPYLPAIISSFGFFGLTGLSIFLSLALDVFNVFVVHLSCFYIYACKLYRLQTLVLYSLWYLFLGKKWNPLRQRFDTAPFQMDRLFVGVLFFSMTVFLLPTTALFYFVFTAVRLVILIVQGLICRLIQFVLGLPVAALIAWIFNSPSTRNTVRMSVVRVAGTSLFLRMQLVKKDFAEFYRERRSKTDEIFGKTYNMSAVVKMMIEGQVLYP